MPSPAASFRSVHASHGSDSTENNRVSGIIGPIRSQRNKLEEELAEHRAVITNREPALRELYIRYNQALANAQHSPRDPEVIRVISSTAGQVFAEETELTRVRSAISEMENTYEHLTNELHRLTAEYEPARLQRSAEITQLWRPVEENKNECATLREAVRGRWASWTAEERVRHFESADFDFGLFLDNKLDNQHDYIVQLQRAYTNVRPRYVIPRLVVLDTLAALVRDGQCPRLADSPLWGEMTIPRGRVKVESLEEDPDFDMTHPYMAIP